MENDGPAVAAQGRGLGLDNVGERLALLYGGESEFSFGPLAEGGFRAAITIPLRR